MLFNKGTTPEAERYPKREFSKTIDGTAICEKCHAVHQNKRWFYDEMIFARLFEDREANRVVCPGCHAVMTKHVDGQLLLTSPQLDKQRAEILSLLHHEEAVEKLKNPLSRIVSIDDTKNQIEVHCTTEFMATRLGHAVHHAHQGDLTIDKVPQEDFVRVRWTGSAPGADNLPLKKK